MDNQIPEQNKPQAQPPATPVPPQAPQPAPVVQQPTVVAPQLQQAKTPAAQLTPEELKKLKEKKAKEKKKRMMTAGIITGVFVFVAIIVTIFILLVQGGGSENPLLKMFGITEENFYPFLIALTNMMFGLAIFIAFIVGVIGAFKMLMAKKDDKAGKQKGMIMAVIGGGLCFVLITAWTFTYLYLTDKQVEKQEAQDTSVIKTDPEELTGLTAPLTIEFDASQIPFNPYKYKILSYEWNFGDGSTATGETVSHRYTKKGPDSGRYQVTLTLTYQDLNSGEEQEETITLDVVFKNEQVGASFTATPESGEIPLEVSFDASESLDPDGEIVSYEWDLDGDSEFDDGEGKTITYTYEKEGKYTVSLRVTDNNGEYNVATLEIDAQGSNSPTAVITEETDEYFAGIEYIFSAEDSTSPVGNEIEKYEWDFGDGTAYQKTRTVKHAYEETGEYTVVLKITDSEGKTGTQELTIQVDDPEQVPVAIIETYPVAVEGAVNGEVPLEVSFDASGSTDADENIVDYEWDFDGDEVIDDTGETVTYTYQEEGTYNATLNVIDGDGNIGTETIVVVVSAQGLKASLSASPVSGEIPLEVEFSAAGSSYPSGEIVAYEWDFGDGSQAYVSGAGVSYEYEEVGSFTATVTVIAGDGSEDTASMNIVVRPVSISACFTPSISEGKSPLVVTFDAGCSTGAISSYAWDFGDGEKSYDRKPTHTFENVGVYTVTLEVEDSSGVSDEYELEITVTE